MRYLFPLIFLGLGGCASSSFCSPGSLGVAGGNCRQTAQVGFSYETTVTPTQAIVVTPAQQVIPIR